MANNQYILVIDTNVLYKDYNKTLDFREFSFSSTFDNIQLKIEELDIVDYVTISVPEMCWEELTVNYIDTHIAKLGNAKEALSKYKNLPEVVVEIKDDLDINKFSLEQIEKYKEIILNSNSGAKTVNLPFPDDSCLKNIMRRAINKSFPFHVTSEHSDYGFKDVIIWESILKYKSDNKGQKIILYSEDGGFHDKLCEEFHNLYNDEIKIIRKIDDLYSLLEDIAKQNVDAAKIYTQEPEGNEIERIKDWLKSSQFKYELFRVINKSIFNDNVLPDDEFLLDYRIASSHVDYSDYLVYMEVLVQFHFGAITLRNEEKYIIKSFAIRIDLPYEDDLPILIRDCMMQTQEETNEWIKELENEIIN